MNTTCWIIRQKSKHVCVYSQVCVTWSPHSQWWQFSWSRPRRANQRTPSWWPLPCLPSPDRTPHVYHQACGQTDKKRTRMSKVETVSNWQSWYYSLKHFKNHVPVSFSRADEELGAIRVGPWICHWQDSCRKWKAKKLTWRSQKGSRSACTTDGGKINFRPDMTQILDCVRQTLFLFSESDASCGYAALFKLSPNLSACGLRLFQKELLWLVCWLT